MTAPKPGDRVKFSGEGVVTERMAHDNAVWVQSSHPNLSHVLHVDDPAVSVEVLPDPEPTYENGARVLLRGLSHTYGIRRGDVWAVTENGLVDSSHPLWDDCQHGTLLVPAEQAATDDPAPVVTPEPWHGDMLHKTKYLPMVWDASDHVLRYPSGNPSSLGIAKHVDLGYRWVVLHGQVQK